MNTHELLKEHGYSTRTVDNYGEVARAAALLARQGLDENEIMHQIERKYPRRKLLELASSPGDFAIFGTLGVHFGYDVVQQMSIAARLPVYAGGALMPDAHKGYALPIGGVVALHEAVSPYGVGVDIACRMAMTIFPHLSPEELRQNKQTFLEDLKAVTRFGFNDFSDSPRKHPVMDDPRWHEKRLPLKGYYDKAIKQLGSSGGGNHFADIVEGIVVKEVDWLPLPVGSRFTALLTHSGSRGVGARMAEHYSKLAAKETALISRGIPKEYAWLNTNTDQGREYLRVMELMGLYAQANHHLIHAHFIRRTGLVPLWMPSSRATKVDLPHVTQPFTLIENHHNYAWVQADGSVVHRKGATPASRGTPGLIPGSSGTPSYLVTGLGNLDSLESSSHGAGRPYSRSEAKKRFNPKAFQEHMKREGILFSGVAPDEAFSAYKDIHEVIGVQEGVLVDIVAEMRPVVVRMGGQSDDGD